jgi:hypothetical protein
VQPDESDAPQVSELGLSGRLSTPAPIRGQVDAGQLSDIIRRAMDMIEYIDSARDAIVLVRHASAVGKLVDEALKSCRLLEEEQFDLKQAASEAHLRTQRRAGELLSDVLLHAGGRPSKTGSHDGAVSERPTLKQLGIDRHESHRWRRIASLASEAFEEYVTTCRSQRRELTTIGALQLANRMAILEREQDDLDARPSGGPALLVEYQKATRGMSELIWLDPLPLASAMRPAERAGEIDRMHRLRLWLDEFEQALRTAESDVR